MRPLLIMILLLSITFITYCDDSEHAFPKIDDDDYMCDDIESEIPTASQLRKCIFDQHIRQIRKDIKFALEVTHTGSDNLQVIHSCVKDIVTYMEDRGYVVHVLNSRNWPERWANIVYYWADDTNHFHGMEELPYICTNVVKMNQYDMNDLCERWTQEIASLKLPPEIETMSEV